MKPIKILHSADFHYSRETQENAMMSLETFLEKGKEEAADLFVIAGDLFDRAVNNTESSGFPQLEQIIKQMLDVAPVVIVTGTPTHDLPGCYDVFCDIKANHNFTILRPGTGYFLSTWNSDFRRPFFVTEKKPEAYYPQLLILGIPEPSKEQFLKDKQLGKEESNTAIKEGMQKLLLGLAAIRKQYSNIPCLLVFHVTIAGSSLHKHQVLPAGGIQIGKDDLALVGADYYALGHIHLAQQIGDLPAYYAGSAFPIDWGETDKKGFNLVTLHDDLHAHVDRLSYYHAPRKKIVTDLTGLPLVMEKGELTFRGYDVWLQIKVDREKRSSVNIIEIGDKLKEYGALMGTFVELVVKPTETIRSAEIQDATNLRDKVKIHGELSGKKVQETVLVKADELEATAKAEGLTAEGLHIRIKKLILRGAIGISKGIGQDQVEIDFDQYDPGLIALIGINGAGKTTLIENMHPYPQMLTRQGKLQDQFCLRDSFRDLYFVDERTGIEYRAFMQIDGVNKSGSVEYYLNRKVLNPEPNQAEWEPLNRGRKDPYVDEIQRLFGSIQLYLRSAFVSQKQPKNLPDLSDATPGERKSLFRELGGLDYLQVYADSAKEKWQALDKELISDRSKIEVLEEQAKTLPDKKGDMLLLEASKDTTELRLKEIEKKGRDLKAQADELSVKVEKNKELRTTIDNATSEIVSYSQEIDTLQESIKGYETVLKGKDATEKKLRELEGLKKQVEGLNEQQTKNLREREKISTEYQNKKDAVADAEKTLLNEKAAIEKEIAELQKEWDSQEWKRRELVEELNQLSKGNCALIGRECPIKDNEIFKQKRAEKQQKVMEIEQKVKVFDNQILVLYKDIGTIDLKINGLEYPKEPELPTFTADILNDVRNKINWIDESALRLELDIAKEAQVRIEEGNARIKLIEKQIDDIRNRLTELVDQIDEEAESAYEEITAELEKTRGRYSLTDKELTRIQTEIRGLEKQIDEILGKIVDLEYLKDAVGDKQKNLEEWQYLHRACGPDGIQALELDAMGPGIADVANSILESAYGSRFQIEFRTTRIGGSGSKTKQIEDFQIIVYDANFPEINGGEVRLEDLSGGESVWIKRAIYDAFGIMRSRKTGTRFQTVFADEADGALDQKGAKQHYFKMLEKAHVESGRYHTIVITHSPEAQEMIGQRIEMSELREAVREEVVA